MAADEGLPRRLLRMTMRLAALPAPALAWLKCRLPASKRSKRTVYVIGDSHASVFGGADTMIDAWPRSARNPNAGFVAYRLGPVLAYRLPDLGTTSMGREKLLATLAYGPLPPKANVLLCFGEIDCRYHLLKEAQSHARPLSVVVGQCVDRYASVAREVRTMGFSTAIWAVVPPNDQDVAEVDAEDDAEYPSWGSTSERLEVTRLFNRLLAERLEPDGIGVVSIFDRLITADGRADDRYYMDSIHLSTAAVPLAVEAISKCRLIPWYR